MLTRTEKKSNKHVFIIDSLRGVAALMVCFYHFAYANSAFLSDENILKSISKYGFLGVEIFFVISGFIICYSLSLSSYTYSKTLTFFKKRITRLEPPYLVSILLALSLGYLSTLSSYYKGIPFEIDLLRLFLHIGYLVEFFDKSWLNPVYWTLAIEFQFYILIALFFPLIEKKRLISRIGIILISLISLFISNESLVIHYLPFFVIGIYTYYYYQAKISFTEFISTLSLMAVVIFYKFEWYYILASIIPSLLILLYPLMKLKVLTYIGSISYSLYLIHTIFGRRIINLCSNFVESDLLRTSIVFITIIICIGISSILYFTIEKPSIKLSKKMS